MLEVFERAAHFTMDNGLRDILLNCSMGIFPKQFRVKDDMIVVGDQEYAIPTDPMDVTNLVHDIMTSKVKKAPASLIPPSAPSRTRGSQFTMDELQLFSMREAERLGKDEEHGRKIWGLIYSSIFLDIIKPIDVRYKQGKIVGIDRIDTETPQYIERE
jgi:hypothetical protein